MQLDPNLPYSIGPFSVISGVRAVAEWLPDDRDGCYVTLDGSQVKRFLTIKIGDREFRPDPAYTRFVRAGIVGSPTGVNADATIDDTYDRTVAYLRRSLGFTEAHQYLAKVIAPASLLLILG